MFYRLIISFFPIAVKKQNTLCIRKSCGKYEFFKDLFILVYCIFCHGVIDWGHPGVPFLLHKNRTGIFKKEEKPRLTHGAAVWRPVVTPPGFCFPVCEDVRERLGTFRVEEVWQA